MPTTVPLLSLVPDGAIVAPLFAATVPEAALQLAERLAAAAAVPDVGAVQEHIEAALPEELVMRSGRGLVLHYRVDGVPATRVAIGVLDRALGAELSGDPTQGAARVLALVVSPRSAPGRHLETVRAVERLLADPAVAHAIVVAGTGGAATGGAGHGGRGQAAELVRTVPALADAQVVPGLAVRDVMTREPRTVAPETALREAMQDMRRAGIGALPVVDRDGRLLGMLGERELLRHFLSHYIPRAGAGGDAPAPGAADRRTVRDVMTRQVLCVGPHQPVADVAALMLNKDVERVPVVSEGVLVGFLTRGDLVRRIIGY